MQELPNQQQLSDKLSVLNPIWITWETQRRNKELALAFNCVFGHFDFSNLPLWKRYLHSARETVKLVISSKSRLVFSQCPSLLLCALILLARTFRKFSWVIDAHNAAVEYIYSNNSAVSLVSKLCLKKADYTIVSNPALCDPIAHLGGHPLILPDKLPYIPARDLPERFKQLKRPLLTLISTFAPDEPIEEFIKGTLQVDTPFTLCITGRKSKAGGLLKYASDKIIFTDFLSEEDYEGLIQHSDLLIDLTTRENCLVCGAYEALAVEVPVLLSDTKALRELFGDKACYSKNDIESYQNSLSFLMKKMDKQSDIFQNNKKEFQKEWERFFNSLCSRLAGFS